jgi:RimJ/RimL family protein N-acetyltransferase
MACIVLDGAVIGWLDGDPGADGLQPGEVNIGYNVFAPHRGQGYATRAVGLLLGRLASDGAHPVAVLRIDRGNAASLRVADKAGFTLAGEWPDELRFARPLSTVPRPRGPERAGGREVDVPPRVARRC